MRKVNETKVATPVTPVQVAQSLSANQLVNRIVIAIAILLSAIVVYLRVSNTIMMTNVTMLLLIVISTQFALLSNYWMRDRIDAFMRRRNAIKAVKADAARQISAIKSK